MNRTFRTAAGKANRGLAAILFVVFLLGLSTMIYADSYEQTLEEQRKLAYGAWHVGIFNADETVWDAVSTHVTVETAARMEMYALLLDGSGVSIGGAGRIDRTLLDIGKLTLLDGRLPEAADEIAMEASFLTQLGDSYELGQTIVLTLVVPDGNEDWAELPCEFTLCGVVENYSAHWKTEAGMPLVSAFLSDEFCGGMERVSLTVYAELKPEFEDSASSLAVLCPRSSRFVLNDYTYLQYAQENPPKTDRLVLQVVILALGAVALVILFHNDLQQRRNSFVLMRTIGATKGQIVGIFFLEKTRILILACLAGIAAGIGLPWLLFQVIARLLGQPVFFLLNREHVIRTILLYLVGLLLALGIGLIQLFQIPLRGIPQQQAAAKHLPKRKPLAVGNLFAVLRSTTRGRRRFSALLSFITAAFVLISAYQAWSRCQSYAQTVRDYPEDYHFGYLQSLWTPENKMTPSEYAQVSSAYGVAEVQRFSVSDYTPIAFPDGKDEAYATVVRQYLERFVENPEQLYGVLIGISENLESVYFDAADAKLSGQTALRNSEVILYLPDFRQQEDGSFDMADFDNSPGSASILEDQTISVGDTILWNPGPEATALTVAGVIKSFGEDFPMGLNPSRPFSMLCSEETYRQITGDGSYTYLLIYGDPEAVQYQTDIELSKVRTGLPFVNDRLEHQEKKQQMNLQVVLSLVVSVSGFLLVWLLRGGIQYSTEQQELQRYRTLYLIGVSRAALWREQFRDALLDSLAGCGLGVAALTGYLYVQTAASMRLLADYAPSSQWEAFSDAMGRVLWYGHWDFVGLLALVLFLLNTALLFLQKGQILHSAAHS